MIPVESKLVDSNGVAFGVGRVENNIRTSSTPFTYDIARGLVSGFKQISKFGHDSAGDTSNHIEVWDGSIAYPYPASAETLYISSSSAGDTQVYEVQGLDANWEEQTVQVTANGQGSVALDGTWIRTFRVKNLGATNNAGNIYISTDDDAGADGIPDSLATQLRAQISIGFNQTLMAIWAVPNGRTRAFITNLYASAAAVSPAATQLKCEVVLWVRPFGGVFQAKKIFSIQSGVTTRLPYEFPLEVAAKSDIRITSLSSAAAEVSAGFDAWYEG